MDNAISIKNFSKSFFGSKAVEDLSFEVDDSKIMAFLGANGARKTTTIRCLLNIYPADKGELLILAKKFAPEMNSEVGYLPEERGIYQDAKLYDFFLYISSLRSIPKDEARKKIDEYLKRVNLFEHKDKKISQLSSGMQQKAQIGISILHNPKVLILDEPFRGLDPINRQLFIDLFQELNKKFGTSILYSTHVVDEAQKLSDEVTIIKNGKLAATGSINDLRNSYGDKTITIQFANKFEVDAKAKQMFEARISNKSAEIIPKEGVDTDQILKYLVNSDIDLKEFTIDRPSLNEVFLIINKDNDEPNMDSN